MGKRRHESLLLDVSVLPWAAVASAEIILARYDLAGSFHRPSVIHDPTGILTATQRQVEVAYADSRWVVARCHDARRRVEQHLGSSSSNSPLHAQVTSCLFAAGVLTHVLLVAGLRNPTVRTRYVAVRDMLASYDRLAVHERLLDIAGLRSLTAEHVTGHLDALAAAFDDAARVIATPVFFAADISAEARPIAIEGSRDLICRGLHREAMFWIAATACRCQQVLIADGTPELRDRHAAGFAALLSDLELATPDHCTRARARISAALPWVMDEASDIVDNSA